MVQPIDDLVLPGSGDLLAELDRIRRHLVPTELDGGLSYHLPDRGPLAGPSLMRSSTGHWVAYDIHGCRVFSIDPGGTVLHECEWTRAPDGRDRLVRARVRLDSLLWVGIIPGATTQCSTLPPPPDGGVPQPDALRRMAARLWEVPLEDVAYFFPDSAFMQAAGGRVTVRLSKDALVFLEDGTFVHPRFLSYMGAIPWSRIDLLNVVELFQSTLPGTGSAVFELLWGLCEDQRRIDGTIPLRYRGLPTYPSEAAYGLFSAFFHPQAPEGMDPKGLFMDRYQAHRIAWWPRPDPPRRYFDRQRALAVTVRGGVVRKVTRIDDPAGIPFVAPCTGVSPSCGRTVTARQGVLELRERSTVTRVALDPAWDLRVDTHQWPDIPPAAFDWRELFEGPPPQPAPNVAHALALFYPDDETEVPELSTQPFVLEQIEAWLTQLPDLSSRLGEIPHVLIDGFDAVTADCVALEWLRHHTVLYRWPEWAQKQAQLLWDQARQTGTLDLLRQTRFIQEVASRERAYQAPHDLIYGWIPFDEYRCPEVCTDRLVAAARTLAPGGFAFLVGPSTARWSVLQRQGLRVLDIATAEDLARLPLLTEHRRLHPQTRLNPELCLVFAEHESRG